MTASSKMTRDILSKITTYMKYARYIPEENRRESYDEIVTRNMQMHLKRYPQIEKDIREAYQFVYDKKVLPSMRSMQFAGRAVDLNPVRLFNCSFVHADCVDAFSETMFLLLSGSGVGFSVQKHIVDKLPTVKGVSKSKTKRHLISDDIVGWANAVRALMSSYLKGGRQIIFDYRDIREKGLPLVTSGGKAPGPEPLKIALDKITLIFEKVVAERGAGTKLKPIEAHDMMCLLADAVLAGGIRRSSLISLFSFDDTEMMEAKMGNWWEKNPHRALANNSAVALRSNFSEEQFKTYWKTVEESRSGEPAIYFTNDEDLGTNPCCEISLKSNQFCNLTEVNSGTIESQEDFNARARAAALIGTLQAGYTDFHYLRDIWQDNSEEDALIGVSLTGIASGEVMKYDMKQAAEHVKAENERIAKLIGINPSKRTTCVKPSGTASLVLGTSSGVHAWHAPYYIRRMRVNKGEPIYGYLKKHLPQMVEDEKFRPDTTAVISIPQKAPENAVFRSEDALSLLNRALHIHKNWIQSGHREGVNTHNVSITVSVKDDEWKEVGKWMWEHHDNYNGIAVLPYDNGSYEQAPFEECTKEEYEKRVADLHAIDLTQIKEDKDGTDLQQEAACAGGKCEVF
ncbi:MAG: recombinase [Alphaproteobacteria bacterium]|nr:recombinase [Alphaproteobacteria bacterium]MBN2779716.1 recombinase [Alphaproteobacteria bacterium]